MPVPMIDPDRIKARMEELGLSQLAAAKRAGLGPDYVRDLLRGRIKEPSAYKISHLARALECSPAYLMGEEDEKGIAPRDGHLAQSLVRNLPIIHLLAEGVYREATSDKAEAPGTIYPVMPNPLFLEYPQWLARVDDDHAQQIIPRGYVVHAVEAERLPFAERPSDIAVVETFRDNGRLVERTVRRILTLGGGTSDTGIMVSLRDAELVGGMQAKNARVIGWVMTALRHFGALGKLNDEWGSYPD